MKTFFLVLNLLCCAVFIPLHAQQLTLKNIRQLNRIGDFYQNGETKGYYCLYEVEKGSKGERLFNLQIFDQDLNTNTTTSLLGHKNDVLMGIASSGNSLMTLFSNAKKKEYTFRQFNQSGEEVNVKTFPENGTAPAGHELHAAPNGGYLYYRSLGKQYSIQYISEDEPTAKTWETKVAVGRKFSIDYLGCTGNTIISLVAIYDETIMREAEYKLMVNDLTTGTEMLKADIKDSEHGIQITNGFLNGDQLQFFGYYYPKDVDVFKEKSLGLYSISLDLNGNVQSQKYLSWEKDVNTFLPVNEKGKVKEVGYLYFHSFVKMPDGTAFGVAESYRRAVDGWGIVGTILSPGSSNIVKTVVEDLYLFEFNPDFSLHSIRVIEKNSKDLSIPNAEFTKPQVLGRYIRAIGGFDFAYLRRGADPSTFMVAYRNLEGWKKYTLGTIRYDGKEISASKKLWSSSNGYVNILPAKPGYVLVDEYVLLRKKQLHLNLVKLDDDNAVMR